MRLASKTNLVTALRALSMFALVAGGFSGCDVPDEEGDDSSESAVTTDDRFKPKVIKNISRLVTVANGQQRRLTGEAYQDPLCKKVINKPNPPRTVCSASRPTDYTNAILHEDPNAVASDPAFPAKWGNQKYVGCGVAAAYNVLAYYGAANPWPAGIRTTKFSDSRIMSVPTSLRTDLENALNRQANGSYSVQLFHGAPAFRVVGQALSRGDVVVALVNGGTHWQVITGMREAGVDEWARTIFEYHAIDYGFGGEWRTEGQLQLGFNTVDSVVSSLGGSDAVGYMSDTFLIVSRQR
jgi:hypothetical protein